MLAKWAQRGNFRGENPRGGRRGEAEGAEKPRDGLCIWNKERIMDVALYM